jgi:hypothetical protein
MDEFPVRALHVSRIAEARADADRYRELLDFGTQRALHDLERGCRQFARRWFGPESLAPAVREMIESDGYLVARPPGLVWPTLGGANASSAAAYFNGASWSTATASRYNAWCRERASSFGAPRASAAAAAAEDWREIHNQKRRETHERDDRHFRL